ncbi:ADAMTS-like protein 3 [Anthonomus grandis grandis]|uniref:ADAMTS-like protein 3 n=1 Tax=Anthonomus grandis grandis TaxID=2921223 RepID=UPI0021652A03|nr:ADAMTS-like protein 3 [Anthonomus grandis grandis]
MWRIYSTLITFTILLFIAQCRPLKGPPEPVQKNNNKLALNKLKEAIDSLKGKTVEEKNEKTLAKADDEDYDSLDDIQYEKDEESLNPIVRGKKNIKQWDRWGKWSACSVSCGVGKMTRWRHCVSMGCADGEKEAQIKTCTKEPCS